MDRLILAPNTITILDDNFKSPSMLSGRSGRKSISAAGNSQLN